jgi:hypothetical protein
MESAIPDALQLYLRNRIGRTACIVTQSSENWKLFRLRSEVEMRATFTQRDEGKERNSWLSLYHQMMVKLR